MRIMTDIMTTTEAAELLRVGPDAIRRWCERGKLEAQRINGWQWAISRDSVMRAYVRKRRVDMMRQQ